MIVFTCHVMAEAVSGSGLVHLTEVDTQHTVGHSKFSFYLAHTGLNSTYGNSSITEQWFAAYFPM